MPPRMQEKKIDLKQRVMDVYEMMDPENTNCISANNLRIIMRSMGLSPTDEDLNGYVRDLDVESVGGITCDAVVDIITRELGEDSVAEKMMASFQILDNDGTGYIEVAEFRNLLLSRGKEPFDAKEVDEVSAFIPEDKTEHFSYAEFVDVLMSKAYPPAPPQPTLPPTPPPAAEDGGVEEQQDAATMLTAAPEFADPAVPTHSLEPVGRSETYSQS
eukprot:GHVU01185061.1.p1 GENE.GHVU01185061.1~~GHVU01185061.1.p1  ORF type:complete len:216 (-),score=41.69 GHVU01185061.1:951-1598(-)